MKIYSRGVFAATWPWLFVLLFAIVPLLSSNRYLLELAILFFVWSAVVTHWNLLIGHAGIFSLVQLAIFNLGGYFTGVIGTHLKIGPVYTLVPAGLFCAFAGFLVGLPCLRLRGAYVALLTLAAHFVVYLLIFTDSSGFTGGGYGLYGFGDYGFRKLFGGGGQLIAHYYVALVLLIICVLAAMAIINSPLGLAFRALRDSEAYAEARGISRYRYQLLVFTLTSFFIGLTGSFYGTHLGLVDTAGFDFGTLMLLLAMIVVGGQGSKWGPILGCATIMVLNELFRDLPEWRAFAIGSTIMVILLVWPKGISGAVERVLALAQPKLSGPPRSGPLVELH